MLHVIHLSVVDLGLHDIRDDHWHMLVLHNGCLISVLEMRQGHNMTAVTEIVFSYLYNMEEVNQKQLGKFDLYKEDA